MCGIIAYLINDKNYSVLEALIKSLKSLQNRGYDSTGIGIFDNVNKTFVTKKVVGNNLDQLYNFDIKKSHIALGHNRWSTHGVVNNTNAHPHYSMNKNFYIVHNGTIDNLEDVKKIIPDYDEKKYSETDTEIFINLIQHFYNQENNIKNAIEKTINVIEGPFAICVISVNNPNEIYFCRRDLPLLIGFSDNMIIASSESVGFYDKVEHYIVLENNDVFVSSINEEQEIINNDINKYVQIRVVKSREVKISYPYPYWTIKEIMEQPLTIMKSLNMGMRLNCTTNNVILTGLKQKKEEIINCKRLLVFGCGTSYHAGLVGNYLFKKIKKFDNCQCILAPEFDIEIDARNNLKDTLCIYLSQSGETKDLVDVLNVLVKTEAINISVINTVNSLIARTTGCGVYVNASREIGVASTKSFTGQVIVLSLIYIWLNQHLYPEESLKERKDMITELQNLPLDIEASFTLFDQLKTTNMLDDINKQSIFILGSHLGYYIAKEGALKIKEISYIHAEAYSLMDLKHGPFALIEDGTPIIVIAHDKISYERSKNICSEIKTRNGLVVFISPFGKISNCDYYIEVPHNDKFSYLLCLIPLQILAYELSLKRGHNPDFPRNLAKSVTVN